MQLLQQSETTASYRRILLACVDATDGFTPETGLTFAAGELKLSKNGATETNHAGTVTEVAGGVYYYEATAGELDTLGTFTVRINKTGVRGNVSVVQVVPFDPYSAASLGLTNLDATVSTRLASAAYTAPSSILTDANGVETGVTVQQALRLMAAVLGGKLSGAGTGTEVFRSVIDSKNRMTVLTDSSGNRTSVTLDLT